MLTFPLYLAKDLFSGIDDYWKSEIEKAGASFDGREILISEVIFHFSIDSNHRQCRCLWR
jgi:hypothetical protein